MYLFIELSCWLDPGRWHELARDPRPSSIRELLDFLDTSGGRRVVVVRVIVMFTGGGLLFLRFSSSALPLLRRSSSIPVSCSIFALSPRRCSRR